VEQLGTAGGSESEVTAAGSSDEPREDRLAVEVREAEPVDGAVLVDQGGGARVAEQAVAADAVAGFDSYSLPDRRGSTYDPDG
jgi:hypothetical protein